MTRLNTIDGLPVFDAKRPLKVEVKASDVAKADLKKPNSCAVAQACYRATHAHEVRVHLGRVYVRTNNTNWQRFVTPKDMRTEIIAFDRGGEFEPGEFLLNVPPPSKKVTGKRQGGASQNARPRKKGKPRKSPVVVRNVRCGPAGGDI